MSNEDVEKAVARAITRVMFNGANPDQLAVRWDGVNPYRVRVSEIEAAKPTPPEAP